MLLPLTLCYNCLSHLLASMGYGYWKPLHKETQPSHRCGMASCGWMPLHHSAHHQTVISTLCHKAVRPRLAPVLRHHWPCVVPLPMSWRCIRLKPQQVLVFQRVWNLWCDHLPFSKLTLLGYRKHVLNCKGTTCEGYHVLSSSASKKGVGGAQLWINSCWHTPQGPLHIDVGNLHILSATTQRMVVRLCKDDLWLILIVAHAPACPTFDEATTFWSALTAMIPSALRSWPLIALLDANARVGSETSDCVGPCGAEVENLAGECFHSWLHQNSLCLP